MPCWRRVSTRSRRIVMTRVDAVGSPVDVGCRPYQAWHHCAWALLPEDTAQNDSNGSRRRGDRQTPRPRRRARGAQAGAQAEGTPTPVHPATIHRSQLTSAELCSVVAAQPVAQLAPQQLPNRAAACGRVRHVARGERRQGHSRLGKRRLGEGQRAVVPEVRKAEGQQLQRGSEAVDDRGGLGRNDAGVKTPCELVPCTRCAPRPLTHPAGRPLPRVKVGR